MMRGNNGKMGGTLCNMGMDGPDIPGTKDAPHGPNLNVGRKPVISLAPEENDKDAVPVPFLQNKDGTSEDTYSAYMLEYKRNWMRRKRELSKKKRAAALVRWEKVGLPQDPASKARRAKEAARKRAVRARKRKEKRRQKAISKNSPK